MGENTKIPWANDSWNAWIGCKKISPGCANCYACTLANLHRWVKKWGKDYRRTRPENWKEPIKWARKAVAAGEIRRVFIESLGDFFDPQVPQHWREDVWTLIFQLQLIGGIECLILTKRTENIFAMTPLGADLNNNIRMGYTAENQECFDKRNEEFSHAWKGKNFISIEPMLGPVDISKSKHRIDWIICGCESGPKRRPANIAWVRALRDQCIERKIPFFLKQWPGINGLCEWYLEGSMAIYEKPILDGRQWLEFPEK
jgi:protein gp37